MSDPIKSVIPTSWIFSAKVADMYKANMRRPLEKSPEERAEEDDRVQPVANLPEHCGTKVNILI